MLLTRIPIITAQGIFQKQQQFLNVINYKKNIRASKNRKGAIQREEVTISTILSAVIHAERMLFSRA